MARPKGTGFASHTKTLKIIGFRDFQLSPFPGKGEGVWGSGSKPLLKDKKGLGMLVKIEVGGCWRILQLAAIIK